MQEGIYSHYLDAGATIEAFDLQAAMLLESGAAELWYRLQADNRLEQDSFKAPVVICYDYQAVA